MRNALNENPVVQLVVIGLIGVVLAFMLFSTVLKKEEVPASDPAAAVDPSAAAPVTPVDPSAAATAPAAPSATSTAPTAPQSVTPGPGAVEPAAAGLTPSDGLPIDVIKAFAKDEAIALLVVDPKGIADRQVAAYTRRLSSRDGVEVFVVGVEDIAKYSRITSGVAVSRAPALLVIQPRRLTNNVPIASVSYGFRSPRSVEQTLDDALYEAGPVSSYP